MCELATDQMASIKRTVRTNIRRLRLEAGLSQQKLAERIGKSLRYINFLENRDSNVTIEVLDALAKGIGVPVADLLADPVHRNQNPLFPKEAEPGLRFLVSFISRNLESPEPNPLPSQDLKKEAPKKQGTKKKTKSQRT